MNRARLMVLIGIAVAVAAAGLIAFLVLRDSDPEAGQSSAFDVHTAVEKAEFEQAQQVANAMSTLPSELAADRLDLLSAEAKAQAVGGARMVFPPGTTVTVDVNSWRRTGTVASVSAMVQRPGNPDPVAYLLLLLRSGDLWQLSEAYSQHSSPSPVASS